MTNGDPGNAVSRNERREAAREKARTLRNEHRKRDRRNRLFIQGGIVLGVLVIVAVVTIVLTSIVRPPSPGPLNMQSDGIKIGQNFKAVATPSLQPGDTPLPSKTNPADVIAIQLYVDYQCPICASFEKANAAQIKSWVQSGAATLEIHPISILDRVSLGQKYSTRAANAAACMANFSPDSYFNFNSILFAHQPKENTAGLTDAQINALVKQAKPKNLSRIAACVRDQTFKGWVNTASTRATAGPIRGTDVKKVTGTPTVIINGAKYAGAIDDSQAFAAAVVKAAGDSFTEDSTATPTPTPAPTP